MISQKTYVKDTRKAIVTRVAKRKWVVARGYTNEAELSYYPRPNCSTQRLAISYVNDWLGIAH